MARERSIEITRRSPHGVMVPDAIGAWAQLVEDHDARSLDELLQPAISLAEDGDVVQSRVARGLVSQSSKVPGNCLRPAQRLIKKAN
jgi:gamma-glutamyltranspeptidase